LTICNYFLPIGNYFVVFDEHNHYVLIHKATIHEQLQHLLHAQPVTSTRPSSTSRTINLNVSGVTISGVPTT
jgi:hypothetical protein